MKRLNQFLAIFLCAVFAVGMLAGLSAPAAASGAIEEKLSRLRGSEQGTSGDNELPIIPIVPHTHVWDEGTVTTAPTCTEPGVMTYHCTTCSNGVKTEPIEALGHDYQTAVTAPTCTEAGYTTYTCTRCGDTYTDDETEALGHDYQTAVTAPTCTEAGYTTYTCARCGDMYTDDETEALGHDYQAAVTAPTCLVAGYTTYICTRCGDTYIGDETEALGHDYQAAVTAPTCTTAGYTVYTCSRCGDTYIGDETEALGHDYQAAVTAPTCTASGYTTYTCARCGSSYVGDETPARGHTPGEPMEENRVEPNCTENGGFDTVTVCAVCGAELLRMHTDLPALGHDWDDGTVEEVPTCTGGGVTVYTCRRCGEKKNEAVSPAGHAPGEPVYENEVAATCTAAGGYDVVVRCTVCGAILSSAHTDLPALGHAYEATVTAPTCLEDGYTTYTCVACGDSYRADRVPALGHDFGDWRQILAPTCTETGTERRDCSRCDAFETRELPANGHDYQQVVTAPTCLEDGYTTHTCAVCGESYKDSMQPALGHDFGEWVQSVAPTCTEQGEERRDCSRCDAFETRVLEVSAHQFVDGVCIVCGAPDPDYVPPVPENPFDDVAENQYFFEAVLWAVANGVTTGKTETAFAPDDPCTRAQAVTFLYRAAGSPALPEDCENPFRDVSRSDYYYDAVLWAVSQGITNGVSADRFAPDVTCTRGQIVTFLYRAAGSPAVRSAENPFADVSDGAYCYVPILWAVGNGITNGTSATTFSPDAPCTRAHVVTFLHRAIA